MLYHFTYRVTFEGTPFYYYGLHSTINLDDGYLGSPRTNKWCWVFYEATLTPLEFFGTRDEAANLERRLILPVLNDPFCLNARCGLAVSVEVCRKAGRISGDKHKRLKTGVCGIPPEEKAEQARRGHITSKQNKTGWNNSEVQRESGKRGAAVTHAQRWQNTDPRFEPFVSTPGGLSHWQRKRGIDTQLRERVL